MTVYKSKHWRVEASDVKDKNNGLSRIRRRYYLDSDSRVWNTKNELLDLQKLLNKILKKKKNARLASKK